MHIVTLRRLSTHAPKPAMKRFTSLAFVSCITALCASFNATAQPFPSRQITLIVPVTPGGSTDLMARQISEPLAKALGQPVIVENRPGASGNIAASYVAKAKPDGYTLLAAYSGYHAGNAFLYKNLDWDPLKSFTPVALIINSAQAIAVTDKLPVKTLKELIVYAKANPGKLNYGTAGPGSLHTFPARCSNN